MMKVIFAPPVNMVMLDIKASISDQLSLGSLIPLVRERNRRHTPFVRHLCKRKMGGDRARSGGGGGHPPEAKGLLS